VDSSQDADDDPMVDCVVDSGAVLVTENVRDFRAPAQELGFPCLRPAEMVALLEEQP